MVLKRFGLRASSELYTFGLDHVQVTPAFKDDPTSTLFIVHFVQKYSKNYAPGLKGASCKKRTLEFTEDTRDPRSFLNILSLYLKKCPKDVELGVVPFFQHANNAWKGEELWYGKKSRVGVNYFPKLMKEAYQLAGLKGDYTLRSIRAGVVQELVENGIPDAGYFENY